jgi:hypothetical protein
LSKRFLAICLSVVVAIVLLAVFVPSCAPPTTTATIEVKATLCGNSWQGALNYTLTGPGIINGIDVPTIHSDAAPGIWNCIYVSGGPPNAFLVDITPLANQALNEGGKITFTLNFEKDQDAGIECLNWTVDGKVNQYPEPELVPCQILDVHFLQWVLGCQGYNVTLNETSWLNITQTAGPGPVQIWVVNASCAVNKTVEQGEPLSPVFQVPSINGTPVEVGMNTTLIPLIPTLLDVHTQWKLVKETDYTKSINWFGISKAPFVPPGQHPCVLFELVFPAAGQYLFTLQAGAQVALVNDVDVNPQNNNVTCPPLNIQVNVGPGP